MKKLSWILIAVGLVIAMVPLAGNAYTSYRQGAIMSDWEDFEDVGNAVIAEENFAQLQQVFNDKIEEEQKTGEEILKRVIDTEVSTPTPSPVPVKKNEKPKPVQKAIGKIMIEKINVNIPIVEGVNKDNLSIGAGHIPGTSVIGEVGNCALAGHRSYTFGRFFNRLNELEIGDKILVTTKKGEFVYTVYKKHIVEPSDTSVLNRNDKDRVLTLITCEPVYIASHRLIIHARIEDE